ncbi:hypothetical protein H4219_002065 [Mycoemilia scoparia]|uniref:Fungal-type protein kinase domain-containing protein n=1 Tax=Mycoemilia scoparia TaxID=417184 RepID=A0A9W8A6L9_9FUNG|nr:hypothetical protein H4219_002065 [Mycoemilia scoparia]
MSSNSQPNNFNSPYRKQRSKRNNSNEANQSNLNISTLVKSRSHYSMSMDNKTKSESDHKTECKEEAMSMVEQYLKENEDGILDLAQPRDKTMQELSIDIDNNVKKVKPTVVIKDAWTYATEDPGQDTCDEIKFLRRINERLADDDSDIIYPKLMAGGRVKITYASTGNVIEDSTATILGKLYDPSGESNAKIPFRAHKRLVMSPIGQPLKTANSFDEFVAVICDAMKCHTRIYNQCNILHRDISDNNILVVRGENNSVQGLLIDFDNAVDLNESIMGARPERTGTFPFMSINNLMACPVRRTALDDWESLLYVICYYATIGLDKKHRPTPTEMAEYAVKKWADGPASSVAATKQANLATIGVFEEKFIKKFNSRGSNDIALFQNDEFEPKFHGTNPVSEGPRKWLTALPEDGILEPAIVNNTDPFLERATEVKTIAKSLMAVVEKYQGFAYKRLEITNQSHPAESK